MIDLKAFVSDSIPYYQRLRAKVVPSGVAEYGERPPSAPGFNSKPPLPLDALECADLEAVALWRILAHYGEHRAFNPYMLASGRKVVGVRLDCDEIVRYMAEDAAECLDWDDGVSVSARTAAYCEWVRGKTFGIVGKISEEEVWITQDEACSRYGLNPRSLWRRREKSGVKFERRNGDFVYELKSLLSVTWGNRSQ